MDAIVLALALFALVAVPFFLPTLDRYRRKIKTRRTRARHAAQEE